ncbi:hypothetical protein G7Y89_g2390 [Cudoniella acicularis]|uniref:DUF155 domain-containing protein n=1 Tax=Cudoniella acicularis TaxID=354080 RepID=A0A8H4RTF7_9HELO|nr:hypothetical protein G7Y89_g2390 [Cudoniella acicularis]
MNSFARQLPSPAVHRLLNDGSFGPRAFRHLHASTVRQAPRKRTFFSSNATLQQDTSSPKLDSVKETLAPQTRKPKRSPAGKTSLRRVAVEAQRSRENTLRQKDAIRDAESSNQVTAISVADQFDMEEVIRILRSHGFPIDPDGTGFDSDQVIHTRGVNNGDIFVFPSGSLVAWSLPEDVVSDLATKTLLPAAVNPHMDQMEMENLEYAVDEKRENSNIKGDVITLGTKMDSRTDGQSEVDTTFAKIAFSSGLARSTKLAVLETMLGKYFESTRTIPPLLSRGSRLPFSRSFMLQKTGELLELRAQLNHYSELTDSLPDLFWDSRHELGLEGYYDQVGKALDVGVRIKTLNEKMDYAQEIASILRQTMSEKHSIHLEWIIIILIAVELVRYPDGTAATAAAFNRLLGLLAKTGALLLFSLALHCSDEYKTTEQYLDKAIDIALSLNMQFEEFAWMHGECDNIPEPRTLGDYDNREFAEDGIAFSSFTYLIDAVRITSKKLELKLDQLDPGNSSIKFADAKLVNWSFSVETQSKCTPPSSLRQTRVLQKSIALHTAKSLEAIEMSIMLLQLGYFTLSSLLEVLLAVRRPGICLPAVAFSGSADIMAEGSNCRSLGVLQGFLKSGGPASLQHSNTIIFDNPPRRTPAPMQTPMDYDSLPETIAEVEKAIMLGARGVEQRIFTKITTNLTRAFLFNVSKAWNESMQSSDRGFLSFSELPAEI